MKILKPNFKRSIDGIEGLAVVVLQDATTFELLMVAFTDESGWRKTVETGMASLFSTSRRKSWVKGEESGNFMRVISMRIDCDGDTLIYLVESQGNKLACHTGARSCFYRGVVGPDLAPAPLAGRNEELKYVEMEVHENMLA